MVNQLDATFSALADPTRRQVIDLLRSGPRRAGDLAARAETSGPAMSRHLRVLRASGLVAAEGAAHDARLRVYRLRKEPFAALRGWVEQVQAFWDDQLEAFREHVERTKGARAPSAARPPRRRARKAPARPGRGEP